MGIILKYVSKISLETFSYKFYVEGNEWHTYVKKHDSKGSSTQRCFYTLFSRWILFNYLNIHQHVKRFTTIS